ncbi:aldehyde dehydrogenase family protein [Brucella pituitosa]|uniref:aldehyde dehydrogenase family protein n=1 Tax=Brucella pituitosa TaxID=571256 RepID=UPI001C2665C1|nr:aldehyde dehydrogenase family protein [Brucella pituitosa]
MNPQPEVLARIAQAGPSDVIRAVEAAAAVQSTWARTSAIERAAVMRRAADILSANAAEYAEWLVRESGSASAKVRIELAAGAAFLQKAASTVLDPQGYVFPQIPGRTSIGRRVPHGVIGIISPFNFPLILSIRSLAPALAVGNAVLLKPDPRTPFSGGVLWPGFSKWLDCQKSFYKSCPVVVMSVRRCARQRAYR